MVVVVDEQYLRTKKKKKINRNKEVWLCASLLKNRSNFSSSKGLRVYAVRTTPHRDQISAESLRVYSIINHVILLTFESKLKKLLPRKLSCSRSVVVSASLLLSEDRWFEPGREHITFGPW